MSWNSFTENTYVNAEIDFTLDYSLMGVDEGPPEVRPVAEMAR